MSLFIITGLLLTGVGINIEMNKKEKGKKKNTNCQEFCYNSHRKKGGTTVSINIQNKYKCTYPH